MRCILLPLPKIRVSMAVAATIMPHFASHLYMLSYSAKYITPHSFSWHNTIKFINEIYMMKNCNQMNVLEQDKSVIQNILHSWHKKRNIKCPTCKSSLFLFDGTPYFSSVRIINEMYKFITPLARLLLETAERLSSFACPVGVKVHIRQGDYKIEDANVSESTATKRKRALLKRTQQRRV